MDAVVFYSCTGQSKAVAKYFADKLSFPLYNIENVDGSYYDNLVLVFPVHCQNIPGTVKNFLKKAEIKHLTAIATYGKMCCGNVLYEIKNKYRKNLIAAAYIPTKHSYLNGESFCNYEDLQPVTDKIKAPAPIEIPKLYKNIFANFFPKARSRFCVKIYKGADCNGCGGCEKQCPRHAVKCGVTDANCIRCLKCVTECPQHALKFKLRLPLRLYLRKQRMNELIIYT